MRVIRADAMGFCFGVRDALALAASIPDPQQITIHGRLVHNEAVQAQLTARGFLENEERPRELVERPTVMITAHGVSDRERERLVGAGKRLVDATCPLVRRAHQAAKRLADEGRHVIVIGQPGHVEVQGIVEDLASYDIVSAASHVQEYPFARLGAMCQTTTPPQLAEAVVAALRRLNTQADFRFVDTICEPTRERQRAVIRLLDKVDGVVVVGGLHSNNTRQLAALCQSHQKPVWHIQAAADLDPSWFTGRRVLGLTAGTSTPDEIIDEVEQALLRIEEELNQ